MKWILIVAALSLAGCMSNEKIVAATKFCTDHGMGIKVFRIEGTGAITRIECSPLEEKK